MTLWKSISEDEYHALKNVIAHIDEAEVEIQAIRGTRLRDHPLEQFRELDEFRLKMQAAVEGYEAEHRQS